MDFYLLSAPAQRRARGRRGQGLERLLWRWFSSHWSIFFQAEELKGKQGEEQGERQQKALAFGPGLALVDFSSSGFYLYFILAPPPIRRWAQEQGEGKALLRAWSRLHGLAIFDLFFPFLFPVGFSVFFAEVLVDFFRSPSARAAATKEGTKEKR